MPLSVGKLLRQAYSYLKAGKRTDAKDLNKKGLSKPLKNKNPNSGNQNLQSKIFPSGQPTSEPTSEQINELIAFYNDGEFEKGLLKIKYLLNFFPQAVVLFNLQGAFNAGLKRHSAAIKSYKIALELKPNFSGAYNNMSISQREIGDLKSAIKSAKQALKIKPDFAEAYLNMGSAQHKKNDFFSAIESYKNALKIKPDYADAYNNMGNAQRDMGDLETAIKSYKKTLKYRPNYAEAYNNIGIVFKDKGNLDQAIDSYMQALKIKPNYAEAHSNMGIALKEKGNLKAAIASYIQALKINPKYAKAYHNMGISQKAEGDLDAALNSYKKALNIEPNYAEVYINIGNIQSDKGNLSAAIKSYKQALKIKPSYAEAFYNLGIAFKDKGDLDEAINSFKQTLEINPDYAEAQHLLACSTGKTTASAPRAYVEKLFDVYAHRFDHSLVNMLEYSTPRILTDIIVENHSDGALGSVLDLGCGTGLTGIALKQFCQKIEGIDLSNSMIEQARKKNVYDRLTHSDIIDYLSVEKLNFDYFIATDVFIYVGDLSEVFRLIKARNKRSGKLVFSTEHTEKDRFFLEKTGRYSHSKLYIQHLCEEFGYKLSSFSTTDLRKEKDRFLTGGLYLLDF